ncbi:MAG: hypothetical protein IJ174_04600, partial [Clostridia bacterium]|nr:hypothetical protein [Clostridia bacterium]
KKGGIAGIVIGVIAIILAISMTGTWSNAFKLLHEKAVEYMPDGIWAKVSEDTTHGLVGIINKLPTDDASLNALVEEMNKLNAIVETQK